MNIIPVVNPYVKQQQQQQQQQQLKTNKQITKI